MQKIPTLFVRNFETRPTTLTEIVTPGCEWVIAGEGFATIKWDGSCCLIRDGLLYKRYDAKPGRTPPPGFEPCEPAPDPITGHWPGWILVGDSPDDKWHREAWWDLWAVFYSLGISDSTYELCGPKVRSNAECFTKHILIYHGADHLPECPRTFHELQAYFIVQDIEGVVWYHPDGRRAKLKGSDFGIRRHTSGVIY